MQFHPFKLQYFNKKSFSKVSLERVLEIKEKNRESKYIPLLYINCPISKEKIYVGDTFYDNEKDLYFVFSLVKEKIPANKDLKCGVKSFGFIIFSSESVHFLPYEKTVIESQMKCIYLGNIFNKNKNPLNLLPVEMRTEEYYKNIYQLFVENNLNVYIKINESNSLSQRTIKLKDLLTLHAVFLKNLEGSHFQIKLYTARNEFIYLEGFSGDLSIIKEEFRETETIHLLVSDRKYLINEKGMKDRTKIKKMMNFYNEIFLSLTTDNSLVHYISPNSKDLEDNEDLYCINIREKLNYYEVIEQNLNNATYKESFLKFF